ncbi:APC family permease [Lewinella sp. W8]|uniref:APC family permease n=1 Tax=Lewinella sp. W8 TaxID=2528208 RepID=UPI001067D3F1|nr:APC family permease [Lewinella sp. W8]MTB51164.1 amino acid permease [Lewinella sp. W8]
MANPPSELKRVLGLRSLFAVAVGVVVAQVVFISVLQGVGIGGSSFFVALFIAFILALFYVFTFAELSLMLPRAGSISMYTEVSLGHFAAIIAVAAGYLAPALFALPAELFLLEAIFDMLYPGSFGQLGLVILIGLAILNVLGVDIFARVQSFLAYLMIIALLVIGVAGTTGNDPEGGDMTSLFAGFGDVDFSVFNLVVLALWAFMGFEFVCPMVEETKDPEKNIPRSMILATIALLFIYALIALAGYLSLPQEELANSEVPHYVLVSALFGDFGKLMLAVLAITATCSTVNTVIATLSRMLFGMSHNKQVPSIFMRVNSRTQTPWVGILFIAVLTIVPYFIFRNAQDVILLMVISAATAWLVAYIINYVNLLILRRRYPDYARPFKSPFYPWAQILGIIGMVYMIINNSPTPEMTWQVYRNAGLLILVAGIYAGLWVRYKMKKGLFDPEPIDQALEN